MSGGDKRGPSMSLRNRKKESDTENADGGDEAILGETVSLASIRNAISEAMANATSELENNISKQLSDFRSNVQEDIKKQLGEMRSDINLKMEETVKKIEAVSQRLGEAEQRVGEVETFSMEIDETLNQMQKTQLHLKSKLTELEGHSRHYNIRIYGIKEGVEGTSMIRFVENLIQAELGEGTGPHELGIERAHRALGPRSAENGPPRSTIVRFLKYSTKERIISAAWKKAITVDGNRVFFDHDYASAVMDKRREYLPIKKVLKEKGIKFRTPMTKMRVFLDSGTVTYDNADQAGDDLRAKGFPIPPRPEGGPREMARPRSSWEQVKHPRRRDGREYQQRIRDKLRGFQPETETRAENC